MRIFITLFFLVISLGQTYSQKIFINDSLSLKKSKNRKKDDLPPEANTFKIEINQDNMFGFQPKFNGSIGYDYNKSITFYAVLWNLDSPRIDPSTGVQSRTTYQWLEAGLGGTITLFKQTLKVNPSVGIVNGKFLNKESEFIAEGITPSIAFNFLNKNFDVEAKGNGFFTFRTQNYANDYFRIHASPGLILNKSFTIGGHAEMFQKIHPNDETQFILLGGFLKVNFNEKNYMKLIAGLNLNDNKLYSKELYRFTAGFSLQ